jgi:SAM-dependent methyltransferase
MGRAYASGTDMDRSTAAAYGQEAMASGAEEFKAFEAAGWSRRANTYGRVSGAITARFVDPLLDAAQVRAGMRVLDVATGPGHVAAAAAARGAEPVGVDIAEGMLAVARRDHPQIDFRPGDAEALPFADASFDAVVGAFVLNHLPRPEVAAAELARVLAAGGRLALSVWDLPEHTRFIGLVRDAVARAGEAPSGGPPAGPDPFRFADEAQLRALLDGAGLDEVAVETVAVRHRVEGDAMALWDGLLAGSVRSAAAVEALSPAARERARAAFAELVEPYRVAGGHELPAVAKVGCGRRP